MTILTKTGIVIAQCLPINAHLCCAWLMSMAALSLCMPQVTMYILSDDVTQAAVFSINISVTLQDTREEVCIPV